MNKIFGIFIGVWAKLANLLENSTLALLLIMNLVKPIHNDEEICQELFCRV